MTPLHILIAGCIGFAGILCAAPVLLIRVIYGPITDPEHIASLKYGHSGRERQRDAAPDMGADIHGAGGGEIIIHHRERV